MDERDERVEEKAAAVEDASSERDALLLERNALVAERNELKAKLAEMTQSETSSGKLIYSLHLINDDSMYLRKLYTPAVV